tara:strand:- start:3165 stop:3626 length:462 start_codon:yes stop_codon:yes gene_type:complete
MEEKTKDFDQKTFLKNDAFGKESAKKLFLQKYKIKLKDNDDIYGTDLIGFYQDKPFYVEASVNNYFKQFYLDKWMAIWQRRIKKFQYHINKKQNVFWAICNQSGKKVALLKLSQDILDLPQEPLNRQPLERSFESNSENVIKVPKEHWRVYEI